MTLAVISGTGLEQLGLAGAKAEQIATPYGEALLYRAVSAQGRPFLLLPRHGAGHSLPPHLINYRANLWALRAAGADQVLALCCVGSLRLTLPPGSLLLLTQFIDQTWGREGSFSGPGNVQHVELAEPYCPRLSARFGVAAQNISLPLESGGCYLCSQGPRLETAAEVRLYASFGADVVGMTGVPEAPLAREAGLCYAALALVANYGAGLAEPIRIEAVQAMMGERAADFAALIEAYLALPPQQADCGCAAAGIL